MEVKYDKLNRFELADVYLCNPTRKKLCIVHPDKDASATLRLNSISELTMNIHKYIKNSEGENIIQPCYDLLETKRLIYIERLGWFEITGVTENIDTNGEYTELTCQSHETVLKNKGFVTEDRLYKFYDPTDPTDKNYNASDVGSIPSVIGQVYQQLGIRCKLGSDLDNVDNKNWVITYIEPRLYYDSNNENNICRTLKSNSTNGYDFMLNDSQEAFEVIWIFDILHHTIKIKSIESVTQTTDIYLSAKNLINSISIEENADDIITVLKCTGSDIDISPVNPMGTDYIVNFDYYMNHENDTYQWMSKELIDAINEWKEVYNSNVGTYQELIKILHSQSTELTTSKIQQQKVNLKITDLNSAFDNHRTSNSVLCETVYEGNKSINPGSKYYGVPFDSADIYTAYKNSPQSTKIDGTSNHSYKYGVDADSLMSSVATLVNNGTYLYALDYDKGEASTSYLKFIRKHWLDGWANSNKIVSTTLIEDTFINKLGLTHSKANDGKKYDFIYTEHVQVGETHVDTKTYKLDLRLEYSFNAKEGGALIKLYADGTTSQDICVRMWLKDNGSSCFGFDDEWKDYYMTVAKNTTGYSNQLIGTWKTESVVDHYWFDADDVGQPVTAKNKQFKYRTYYTSEVVTHKDDDIITYSWQYNNEDVELKDYGIYPNESLDSSIIYQPGDSITVTYNYKYGYERYGIYDEIKDWCISETEQGGVVCIESLVENESSIDETSFFNAGNPFNRQTLESYYNNGGSFLVCESAPALINGQYSYLIIETNSSGVTYTSSVTNLVTEFVPATFKHRCSEYGDYTFKCKKEAVEITQDDGTTKTDYKISWELTSNLTGTENDSITKNVEPANYGIFVDNDLITNGCTITVSCSSGIKSATIDYSNERLYIEKSLKNFSGNKLTFTYNSTDKKWYCNSTAISSLKSSYYINIVGTPINGDTIKVCHNALTTTLDNACNNNTLYFLDGDRTTYCKITPSTSVLFIGETIYNGQTSSDTNKEFLSSNKITCYKFAPQYVNESFTFGNQTGNNDIAQNNYQQGYLYFVDNDTKTYCKLIQGNNGIFGYERYGTYSDMFSWCTDVVKNTTEVYASGFSRFTRFGLLNTWIEKYDAFAVQIDAKVKKQETDIQSTNNKLKNIAETCNIRNFIYDKDKSGKLLNELDCYWIQGDYENSTIVATEETTIEEQIDLANELMENGTKQLEKVSQPKFSLTIPLNDFIKNSNYKHFAEQFELGRVVYAEIADGVVYKPAATEITFNLYNQDNFSITFSNSAKLSSNDFTFTDLITQNSQTSKSVEANWTNLVEYVKDKEKITSLIENPLDLTLRAGQSNMSRQEFVIDTTGILGRRYADDSKTTFDKEQMKIMNNSILFTDDNWKTIKSALGKIYYENEDGEVVSSYGLIAETIIGELIMSERLKVSNRAGSVILDERGILIKDEDGNIVFNADCDGNMSVTGFVTDTTLNNAITDVNSSIASTNNYIKSEITKTNNSITTQVSTLTTSINTVDGKFANYYTSEETDSKIQTSANSITLSVSKTYATQTSLATTNTDLATTKDNLAKNYLTTTETRSEIAASATAIQLSVSETYATQDSLKTTNTNLATTQNNLKNNYYNKSAVDASLVLKIDTVNGKKIGVMSANANYISFTSNQLEIDTDTFKLTKEGVITATAGNIGSLIIDSIGISNINNSNEEMKYVLSDKLSKQITLSDGTAAYVEETGLFIGSGNGDNFAAHTAVTYNDGVYSYRGQFGQLSSTQSYTTINESYYSLAHTFYEIYNPYQDVYTCILKSGSTIYAGSTINNKYYPETTPISSDILISTPSTLAKNTVIFPGSVLEGTTYASRTTLGVAKNIRSNARGFGIIYDGDATCYKFTISRSGDKIVVITCNGMCDSSTGNIIDSSATPTSNINLSFNYCYQFVIKGENFTYNLTFPAGNTTWSWDSNAAGVVTNLWFIDTGSTTTIKQIPASTSTPIIMVSAPFAPLTNGTYNLGTERHKWNTVFASTGAINTSDANEKNTICDIDERYGYVFDNLRPVTYKLNEGTSGRTHVGFIAQELKESILNAELTTKEYAAYCEWDIGTDFEGCGIRYEEIIPLNTYEIQKLKARVAELEQQIKNLTNN